MVVVTYFNSTPAGPAQIMQRSFSSMPDALVAARNSGSYFDLCDMRSGRTFIWEECIEREEDDWYYDETEAMWKKAPKECTE